MMRCAVEQRIFTRLFGQFTGVATN